ncbi:hypothetical protein [Candidatus Endomicrobiellum trichonymphae]|uniref:hypothetical protein n=1 Tax=Endomicrobium trichonymphae TaxID=1408204 RepID=UPI001E62C765|nr:hypothetical protein [Candidatus Endomicrobium trichonymphae]
MSKTEPGETIVKFNKPGILELLQEHGIMPLPPKRKGRLARKLSDFDRPTKVSNSLRQNFRRYCSSYSRSPLYRKYFKEKGINIATLTLHARWETFKYITATPQYTSGKFSIDKINAEIIN